MGETRREKNNVQALVWLINFRVMREAEREMGVAVAQENLRVERMRFIAG